MSRELDSAIRSADKEAHHLGDVYVSAEHLLIGVVSHASGTLRNRFSESNVTKEGILKVLKELRGNQTVNTQNPEDTIEPLCQYGKDFTELARSGKIDPVIGRDDEIRNVIRVLLRRNEKQSCTHRGTRSRENSHSRRACPAHSRFRCSRGT